jgi:phosphohistidine phosphatase
MNLYFLRHGLAVEPGTQGFHKDSERPLTDKGERKLQKIARGMEAMELRFDLVLSSPYLRATQTARIMVKAMKWKGRFEIVDELAPSGSPRKLVDLLNHIEPSPADVLLVGHEPWLSEFMAQLVSENSTASLTMKKGGLGLVTTDSLTAGKCGRLEWLLTPAQMAMMT